jgi:hypothetical protein
METQLMTFEEFKKYIVSGAKEKGACAEEFKRALSSTDWAELLTVIKDNANWCYVEQLTPIDIMRKLPKDVLRANGIYVDEQNIEQREGFAIYFSSTSEHYDSSTSEHYGSSTSKHYDSSTSKHYGSSTSKHYDSSTSEHYGSSTSEHYDSSTSEHYGSSTSEHYGSSTSKHYFSSTSKHYGSSTSEHYFSSTSKHYGSSTSEHYDSSTSKHYGSSTSKHYGSSTSEHYGSQSYGNVSTLIDTSIIHDSAIVRERSTGRVFFKKGGFEIVEL